MPIIKLSPSQSLNNPYKFVFSTLAGAILASLSLPVWAECSTTPVLGANPDSETYTINGTCTFDGTELTIGEGKSVTLQGGEGIDNKITGTGESSHATAIYVDRGLLTLKGGLEVSGGDRIYGIRLEGTGASVSVEGGRIIGIYGYSIYAANSGDITVSDSNVTGGDIGIEAENSGDIIISNTHITGDSDYGIYAQDSGNITLSGGEVGGRWGGVYMKKNGQSPSPTILTLSNDVKIRLMDQSSLSEGAIFFHDQNVSSRHILKLATNPDNIQGAVWSAIRRDESLQNTNTLVLEGKNTMSFNLTQFGTIEGDKPDARWFGPNEEIWLSDEAKKKGRNFFAFDTITKEDSGT